MITTGANSQGELDQIRESEIANSVARSEKRQEIISNFDNVKKAAESGLVENIQSMAGEEWLRKQQEALAPTFHEE